MRLTKHEVESILAHGITDLSRADLSNANLYNANLIDANLIDANLIDANLIDANLIDANLIDANLSGANLIDANLSGANLIDANLSGANLIDANLSGANLSGANLYNATGNSREIVTIQTKYYTINMTKDFMDIGCEKHSYNEWYSFDDETISAMDGEALEFWNKYKEYIKTGYKLAFGD